MPVLLSLRLSQAPGMSCGISWGRVWVSGTRNDLLSKDSMLAELSGFQEEDMGEASHFVLIL